MASTLLVRPGLPVGASHVASQVPTVAALAAAADDGGITDDVRNDVPTYERDAGQPRRDPDGTTREDAMTTAGGPNRNLVLAAMIFAVAMTFIDQTIVSIAVPNIQRELASPRPASSGW